MLGFGASLSDNGIRVPATFVLTTYVLILYNEWTVLAHTITLHKVLKSEKY